MLVREPLAARATRSGSTSAATGRRSALVVRCPTARASSSPSPTSTTSSPTRRSRDDQARQLIDWLGARPPADAPSSSATSTPSRTSPPTQRMRDGRLPVRVRRGERRRARRRRGRPGSRRRAWTPTASPAASTTSGSAARSRSSRAGSRSTGRRSTTRRSIRRITSGSSRSSRSAEWRLSRRRPFDSPTAATGGARPRTRSPRSWPRSTCPGCDGLEFDVRASADGVPVAPPRRDARPRPGRRPAGRRPDGRTSSTRMACPTLEEVLAAVPRRAFLDVELKGDPGRGAVEVLTAGRGPGLERAVVSSFEPATLERVGRLGADLAALAERPRPVRRRRSSSAQRSDVAGSPSSGTRSTRGVARAARDAGLEVAAWTVRRRPTYAPPGAARRRRDLRRGAPRSTADRGRTARTRVTPTRRPSAPSGDGLSSADDDARSSRPRRRRRGHDRRLGVVLRRGGRRRPGRRPRARARRDGRRAPAPPGSSGPRAGRRRPSRSAAGRSTSTARQAERYGTDSGFRELGYLILAVTEDDERAGRERVAMQQARGPRRPLARRAAEAVDARPDARARTATAAAATSTTDGHIDPPRNVRAYSLAMQAAGVELRERTAFTGLRTEPTPGGGRASSASRRAPARSRPSASC